MKPDKNIEEFTKYVLKEVKTETPSDDFVTNVMQQITLEGAASEFTSYRPLISKYGWAAIFFVAIALCVFIFKTPSDLTLEIPTITILFLDKFSSLNIFEGIKFSKLFTFSFIAFSVLVWIQLLYIKNYINKQNTL